MVVVVVVVVVVGGDGGGGGRGDSLKPEKNLPGQLGHGEEDAPHLRRLRCVVASLAACEVTLN